MAIKKKIDKKSTVSLNIDKVSTTFWTSWTLKPLEKKAVRCIKKALDILFKEIPFTNIYAIYIKGSFTRRELVSKSDVDIVPITYKDKDAKKIQELQKHKSHLYKPAELLPHSLEEFENKKPAKKGMARYDVLLREIHTYKKIYGKKVIPSKYSIRSDKEFFESFLKTCKYTFIPQYKKNKMSFWNLSKQIIHLAEKEDRLHGKKIPKTWKTYAQKKAIVKSMYLYRQTQKNEDKHFADVCAYIDTL